MLILIPSLRHSFTHSSWEHNAHVINTHTFFSEMNVKVEVEQNLVGKTWCGFLLSLSLLFSSGFWVPTLIVSDRRARHRHFSKLHTIEEEKIVRGSMSPLLSLEMEQYYVRVRSSFIFVVVVVVLLRSAVMMMIIRIIIRPDDHINPYITLYFSLSYLRYSIIFLRGWKGTGNLFILLFYFFQLRVKKMCG